MKHRKDEAYSERGGGRYSTLGGKGRDEKKIDQGFRKKETKRYMLTTSDVLSRGMGERSGKELEKNTEEPKVDAEDLKIWCFRP